MVSAGECLRVLICCRGSQGDVLPYLTLAGRLRELGHQPTVATREAYRKRVESRGLQFWPLPDIEGRVVDLKGLSQQLADKLPQSYESLTGAAAGVDLVVSHPLTFAARMVAEKQGCRWLSTVLAPYSLFSRRDLPICMENLTLNRCIRSLPWLARLYHAWKRWRVRNWASQVVLFRKRLGLPRVGHPLFEGQYSPYGNLLLFSSLLASPQSDWPPRARTTGFIFPAQGEPLEERVEAFVQAGEPPLVVTAGTSPAALAQEFFEVCAATVRKLGRRLIVLTGGRPFQGNSDRLLCCEAADHQSLFPRAAAVVHHGGIGTLAQTLKAGRPSLIVPGWMDQPDNAERARKLGCSLTLPSRRFGPGALEIALSELLGNAGYADRAAAVSRQVQVEPGAGGACDAILQLARC